MDIYLILIIGLFSFTMFTMIISYIERSHLLNRLMARNYEEYATQEVVKIEAKKKPRPPEDGIPL